MYIILIKIIYSSLPHHKLTQYILHTRYDNCGLCYEIFLGIFLVVHTRKCGSGFNTSRFISSLLHMMGGFFRSPHSTGTQYQLNLRPPQANMSLRHWFYREAKMLWLNSKITIQSGMDIVKTIPSNLCFFLFFNPPHEMGQCNIHKIIQRVKIHH